MYVMSPNPLEWVPEIGFHVRLREVRRQHGQRHGQNLTQAEFAEACGFGVNAYKQWETGNNKPDNPQAVAERIAQVTGVSAAWLLGEDFDNPPGGGNIVPLNRRRKGPDVQNAQYIYTARPARRAS